MKRHGGIAFGGRGSSCIIVVIALVFGKWWIGSGGNQWWGGEKWEIGSDFGTWIDVVVIITNFRFVCVLGNGIRCAKRPSPSRNHYSQFLTHNLRILMVLFCRGGCNGEKLHLKLESGYRKGKRKGNASGLNWGVRTPLTFMFFSFLPHHSIYK